MIELKRRKETCMWYKSHTSEKVSILEVEGHAKIVPEIQIRKWLGENPTHFYNSFLTDKQKQSIYYLRKWAEDINKQFTKQKLKITNEDILKSIHSLAIKENKKIKKTKL